MFAEENLGLGKWSAEAFVCTKLLEFGYPNFTTTGRQAAVNYHLGSQTSLQFAEEDSFVVGIGLSSLVVYYTFMWVTLEF
jgi:hypothetical protein